MDKIVIFGGTIEGRQLAEYYRDKEISVILCVATEYGESLIKESQNLRVYSGRLDCEQIRGFLEKEAPQTVIDATHPYAKEVTQNVKKACEEVGFLESKLEYIRLIRQSSKQSGCCCKYFADIGDVISYLNEAEGRVLLTTGSKDLETYAKIKNMKERVCARILPLPSIIQQATDLGYHGKNLICMQGPFSEAMNVAMIEMLNVRFLVTKDTGENGGFPEKMSAAQKTGIEALVIGRPEDESGMSFNECLEYVNQKYDLANKRIIKICGIGMGNEGTMTQAFKDAVNEADAVIGAKRLLQGTMFASKKKFEEIETQKIAEIIDNHKELTNITVVMSGDTGFYSGAKGLLDKIGKREDLEVGLICGISSAIYFCSKIGQTWQDAKMYSAHGRDCNYIEAIKRNRKTFFLLGGKVGVKEFLTELVNNGLGKAQVYIGENLSYDKELISQGKALDLVKQKFDSLAVAIVVNATAAEHIVTPGISDEEFTRGEVPMTKEEVRAITLSKMQLTKESVIYDIGAGTGSVSIECGRQAYEGSVFAIEKETKGIELINKNKQKFGVTNVHTILGTAPQSIKDLPVPTHAFIGGSSGNMGEIVACLFEKNPFIRLVINTVTLESISEAMEILKKNGIENIDVIQVNISKNKKAGKYNLMTAHNPVFIISCTGGKSNE